MTITLNEQLVNIITKYTSTLFWPNDFSKEYPYDVVFTETNYYKFMGCLSQAEWGWQNLADTITDLTNPYDPLTCNANVLPIIRSRIGLQFVTSPQTTQQSRYTCQARIYANVTTGTTDETMVIVKYLMMIPSDVLFYQIGHLAVQYTAINGTLPISLAELDIFWSNAHMAGVYNALVSAPLNYFALTTELDENVYSFDHGLGVLQDDDSVLGGGNLGVLISYA